MTLVYDSAGRLDLTQATPDELRDEAACSIMIDEISHFMAIRTLAEDGDGAEFIETLLQAMANKEDCPFRPEHPRQIKIMHAIAYVQSGLMSPMEAWQSLNEQVYADNADCKKLIEESEFYSDASRPEMIEIMSALRTAWAFRPVMVIDHVFSGHYMKAMNALESLDKSEYITDAAPAQDNDWDDTEPPPGYEP